MPPKKNLDLDDFIREAQRGLSPSRLAVRYGIAVSSVRKVAKANGIELPTLKELRRRNGLPGSTRWNPQAR